MKPDNHTTKNRTAIGGHPPNGVSVRSYHEVEMRACLDGRGGAIRINDIGARYDHWVNRAIQAGCVDGIAVAFSVVRYFSNRGTGPSPTTVPPPDTEYVP
jgi:hypothetical protein